MMISLIRQLYAVAIIASVVSNSIAAAEGTPTHLRGAIANNNTGAVENSTEDDRRLSTCDVSTCPHCSGKPCLVCVQMKEVECCLRDACHGCSGEQCGHCQNDARLGCCLGKWMAQHTGKCNNVDLPDYNSCPRPTYGVPSPVCIQSKIVEHCLNRSCKGCSGEQCAHCRNEHTHRCCHPHPMRGSIDACSGHKESRHKESTHKESAEECFSRYCKGCGGEQCTYCRNEHTRECV